MINKKEKVDESDQTVGENYVFSHKKTTPVSISLSLKTLKSFELVSTIYWYHIKVEVCDYLIMIWILGSQSDKFLPQSFIFSLN